MDIYLFNFRKKRAKENSILHILSWKTMDICLFNFRKKRKVPSEYQIPSSSILYIDIYIKWIILVITGGEG